jgi:hypothetical protein
MPKTRAGEIVGTTMPDNRPLADDLLTSINAMAVHMYGEATPYTVRRIRHLIDRYDLPVTRKGGKIESRRSWLNEWYGEPDRRAENAEDAA